MQEAKYLNSGDLLPKPGKVDLTLGARDSVDDPTSTKRRIWGPALVRLIRYPDGGLDAVVQRVK